MAQKAAKVKARRDKAKNRKKSRRANWHIRLGRQKGMGEAKGRFGRGRGRR